MVTLRRKRFGTTVATYDVEMLPRWFWKVRRQTAIRSREAEPAEHRSSEPIGNALAASTRAPFSRCLRLPRCRSEYRCSRSATVGILPACCNAGNSAWETQESCTDRNKATGLEGISDTCFQYERPSSIMTRLCRYLRSGPGFGVLDDVTGLMGHHGAKSVFGPGSEYLGRTISTNPMYNDCSVHHLYRCAGYFRADLGR